MLPIHLKTFNPEILYVFDSVNKGPASGKKHAHDFFELSIILSGESFYIINEETHFINEATALILNPGVEHQEYIENEMENLQIHIGLRNFNFIGFQNNFMPLESQIIQLGEHQREFLQTCEEIIFERRKAKPGYKLILKSLVYKLIIYLFRDEKTKMVNNPLLNEDHEKQKFIKEIQIYIENNYNKDLTLEQLTQEFSTSSATLSRDFKEVVGDTPINYLINYRLNKAKDLIQSDYSISIKEIAQSVGYEDPLYFSKLFKKHYGFSPTLFVQQNKRPK